jgi:hypothetical protein
MGNADMITRVNQHGRQYDKETHHYRRHFLLAERDKT